MSGDKIITVITLEQDAYEIFTELFAGNGIRWGQTLNEDIKILKNEGVSKTKVQEALRRAFIRACNESVSHAYK